MSEPYERVVREELDEGFAFAERMIGHIRRARQNGRSREETYAALVMSIDTAGGPDMNPLESREYMMRCLAAALLLLSESIIGADAG